MPILKLTDKRYLPNRGVWRVQLRRLSYYRGLEGATDDFRLGDKDEGELRLHIDQLVLRSSDPRAKKDRERLRFYGDGDVFFKNSRIRFTSPDYFIYCFSSGAEETLRSAFPAYNAFVELVNPWAFAGTLVRQGNILHPCSSPARQVFCGVLGPEKVSYVGHDFDWDSDLDESIFRKKPVYSDQHEMRFALLPAQHWSGIWETDHIEIDVPIRGLLGKIAEWNVPLAAEPEGTLRANDLIAADLRKLSAELFEYHETGRGQGSDPKVRDEYEALFRRRIWRLVWEARTQGIRLPRLDDHIDDRFRSTQTAYRFHSDLEELAELLGRGRAQH
jgi:hypothetical protein